MPSAIHSLLRLINLVLTGIAIGIAVSMPVLIQLGRQLAQAKEQPDSWLLVIIDLLHRSGLIS